VSASITEKRSQLLTRKRDLFASLRVLEQDHIEGAIDEGAYASARARYELEAANVLEQLDALPPTEAPASAMSRARPPTSHRSWLVAGGTVVVAAAIFLFLLSALHPRSGNQSITGSVPTIAPASGARESAQLKSAERAVSSHPRSVDAWIALGNQYLTAGQASNADQSYQDAMRLDPRRPEPKTLHAMMVGSTGHYTAALQLVHQVERSNPTYSRAWLMDGLLSSHNPRTAGHAIAAWRRFLALEPHSAVSAQVKGWIAAAKKVEKRT
jgi:cytochrome c-type biogenesis protein CcmH/NrfG